MITKTDYRHMLGLIEGIASKVCHSREGGNPNLES